MINMANESSAPFLTSSQENMVLNETMGMDLQDFGDLLETQDVKYDISQHLLGPEQQQQQPQHPQVLMLPEYHLPLVQVPTSEVFPGHLNFQVDPAQQDDAKSAWTFSPKLGKVFIKMGETLPVRIKWSTLCPGLYIRASMVFCQSAHRSEPVTRCHNHIESSKNEGMPNVYHILNCKHTNTVYAESNGHYSVIVPLDVPQPGSNSIQMDFLMRCKNSCTGVNRRATEIVFNLENEAGHVLGRRKLLVRICSCPKRDREKEEKTLVRDSYPLPSSKKRKLAGKICVPVYREQPEPDPEIFQFSARIYGRENFEMVRRVAYSVMLETLERTGQQAIRPLLEELNNMR